MSTTRRRPAHIVKDTGPNAYREAREQTGQTITEWASENGVSYSTVRKWESGERRPSLDHERMMAWISRGMFVTNHAGVSWEPDPVYVDEIGEELRPVLGLKCAQCRGPLPLENMGAFCGECCLEQSEIDAIDRNRTETE